jgi:hypothetical protein
MDEHSYFYASAFFVTIICPNAELKMSSNLRVIVDFSYFVETQAKSALGEIQLNEYEAAPYSIQLSQNLTLDCLLISVLLPVFTSFCMM